MLAKVCVPRGRCSYLTALNAHIRHTECGSAPETDARVAGAVDGPRHVDLDILEMGALSNTPPERNKRRVGGDVGRVEDNVLERDGERQLSGDAS